MSSLIANGTYFIKAQTGAYVALTNTSSGTNLTTWHYDGGAEQQWSLTGTSGPGSVYTIKNVEYGTYITYPSQDNAGAFVTQSSTPYDWFVEIHSNPGYGTGYAFSNTDDFGEAWNVADGYTDDNNPVIMYGCCDVWTLQSASTSSTISIPSSSSSVAASTSSGASTTSGASTSSKPANHVPLIVGLVVGIVGGVFVILVVGFTVYRCYYRPAKKKSFKAPVAPMLEQQ